MAITTLDLRDRSGASKTTARATTSRRSQRVVIDFPVTVFAQGMDGKIFSESTTTMTVNAHGALVSMSKEVNPQSAGNPRQS